MPMMWPRSPTDRQVTPSRTMLARRGQNLVQNEGAALSTRCSSPGPGSYRGCHVHSPSARHPPRGAAARHGNGLPARGAGHDPPPRGSSPQDARTSRHPPRPEAVRNTPHHGSEQLAPRARPRPHPAPPRPPRRGRSGRRRRPRLGRARHRLHRRRRPRERPGTDGGLLLLAVHLRRRAGPGRRHRLHLGRDARRGDSGASVERLQSALNDRGAEPPVTGFFGSMTEAAVQDVQSSAGIAVDGVVGGDTRAALEGGSGSVDSSTATTSSTTSVSTGGASVSTASTSTSGNAIVDAAGTAVGTPYSWGESSLSGMDCSGLVAYAYGQAGIDVPRTSDQQAAAGTSISQSELQPGDLVVWPGHIAIYSGDGKIIDASGSKQQVVEREIWGNPTDFVTYR
ncbi:NlpC/P60 family protein [Brachybacterium sp. GPGPB12]|uniref:C40 family peptidase n=1 Tax=Brachybacterium sp. GPGPB12 TaxID=3023517 RepID=UPI0031345899